MRVRSVSWIGVSLAAVLLGAAAAAQGASEDPERHAGGTLHGSPSEPGRGGDAPQSPADGPEAAKMDTASGRGAQTAGLPPASCVGALRSARILLERGDQAAAGSAYEAAAEACPGRLEPLLDGLAVAQASGDREAAEAAMARLVAFLRDPEHALQLAVLERAVADAAVPGSVLEAIRDRLQTARGDHGLRTWRALAVAASRVGDAAAARAALEPVLAAAPSPEVRWTCVHLDRSLERWPSVVEQLEALIAEDPVMADLARLQLVEAYARAGRFEEALATAEVLTAPAEDPAGPAVTSFATGALLEAAWALHDAGRTAEAKETLRRVVSLDPSRTEAADALALLYGPPSARRERARAEEARLASDGDPEELLRKGTERLGVGDPAGAIPLLERAAGSLSESELAWYNLGMAAIQLERWELAASALDRAVALDPGNHTTRLNLGTALARTGSCGRALEVLDALVAERPDLYQAHYWRWSCLRAAGDPTAAAEALAAYEAGRQGG